MSSHPKLQKLLRKNHTFLYNLWINKAGYKNKRIIDKASAAEVKTVLRILLCLREGHIDMWMVAYRRLVKSKRKNLLLKANFSTLLNTNQREQRQFVKKIASQYYYMLHPMFSEDGRNEESTFGLA
jgi:Mn-containing catalase